MSVLQSTNSYEKWLSGFAPLDSSDIDYKRARMADGLDAFPFFRGTYYRWAKQWPNVCPDLDLSPRVLAVGDLHIENFGTWRDAEGRLCWGINDFDEADELPYTHDLVRLAASVRFARSATGFQVKFKSACSAILEGYRTALEAGGDPFVLEERHPALRGLATSAERDPIPFWKKLTKLLATEPAAPPPAAMAALLHDLPSRGMKPEFRRRMRVGMGSLGKPRFLALVEWEGGWVAREAKLVTPPATAWAFKRPIPSRMAEIVANARRCPDPFYRPGSHWIARRLAPHCSRIELDHLSRVGDVVQLLHAMGAETANVHLGTEAARDPIRKDLAARPAGWLAVAAKAMAGILSAEWTEWRSSRLPSPAGL